MAHLRVLVIDDQALDRRILLQYLKEADIEVLEASNGPEGIGIAESAQPDVVLLDVMMEEMDGLGVCRSLKANPQTADIPVIFITSIASRRGSLEGLGCGAADYLNKPVDRDSLLARIRTHARMRQQHLKTLALTAELEQARRQNEVMHLTEGIAHNLNNLLGVIFGYLGLLQQDPHNGEKVIRNCSQIEAAIHRMTKIVRQLSVIGQFHSAKLQPVRLSQILQGAITRLNRAAKPAIHVRLVSSLPEDFSWITNREILESCLEHLLLNAQQSYGKSFGDHEVILQADLCPDPKALCLRVLDEGCGIPHDLRDSVFDPFVSTSAEVGRGMGLTLARHGARCLHGDIFLLSRPTGGTEARLTLPPPSSPHSNS